MGELIPLFPLGTPLFPGVVLPLQIFEPRYRRLMQDLLSHPESGDRRFFGVVAIRQGWEVEQVAPAEALYDIGCTARLQAVRPQPDGGFRIVTVGGDRFRLLDVVVGDDPPYLQAEVEWLDEEESAAAQDPMDALARGVRQQFTRYVSEVAGLSFGGGDAGGGASGRSEAVDAETAVLVGAVADDPTALSYLVASVALLTTEDRQALLAEPATRRRLVAESLLLRRELCLLQTLGAVPVSLHEFATPMTVN
jgi:ATP-dependent Lon protease